MSKFSTRDAYLQMQNNFYRQIRNFIIDMEAAPLKDYIAGLHW